MQSIEESLRKNWRTVGYWGLTLNVIFAPAAFIIIPTLAPTTGLEIASQHFPMMLTAWVAAAAVRQWGKIKGTE
jgi:hypothetical protein